MPSFVEFVVIKKEEKMRKITIALIAVVALMVIGCQPPEGMGGVTTEQFEGLKTEIQTLKTDLANTQAALDSLTTIYNAHVEKFHKGGTTAPKPPTPTREVKPPEKG